MINSEIRRILTYLLILMSVSPVVAQESWDFGDHQKAFISSIPQRPLRVRMHPGTSLRSLKFVTKVGGVAFQATATADESIAYKSIHIFYNEDNDDGRRLGIVIDRDTTYERIPDWQLIPIVEYANSSYNSCVSWFGPESNDMAHNIIYHPAFENTLLGIRLLQADMALLDVWTHYQLPRLSNQLVLGQGEDGYISSLWNSAANEINVLLSKDKFEAWVLTDDESNVSFGIGDYGFYLEGWPYYYFWSYDLESTKREEMLVMYHQILEDEYSKLAELHEAGKGNYEHELEQKWNEILEVEFELDNLERKIVPVDKLTNLLRPKYELYRRLNKPVYEATQNTMRYSAFFRYLKKNYYWNWEQFYQECSQVEISPSVKTPAWIPR